MPYKDTWLPSSHCTGCGKLCNAAFSVEGHLPNPGDFSVCLYCGHLMAFGVNFALRELTDAEMVELAGRRDIIANQKLRK
jgi:hypothetical protein